MICHTWCIMYIFGENNPVVEHTRDILNELRCPLYSIETLGKISAKLKPFQGQIEAATARKIRDKSNLACKLEVRNWAQAILAIKNNLEDRLVNGLVGRVMGFKSTGNTFNVIYIKFNDKKAGQIAIHRESNLLGANIIPNKSEKNTSRY